jgi:YihY family inner membrane protein
MATYLTRFYRKAYEDNLTGLSGMVGYNLLLSVLPLALLALFIGGQVLSSSTFEHRVLDDLRRIFPNAAESTLTRALHRVQHSTGGIGIAALVASVWIGSSFWGALDTAFCRIYHVECRGWVQQKRFALGMLVVVLLFVAATLAVPTLQSILTTSTENLPFGLRHVRGLVFGVSLAVGLVLLWGVLCVIYWRVPNEPVPWRAIWPGAAAATLAMAAVDYAFPFYLSNVNTIAQLGTTLVFVLIVLIWFYVLAIILLGGATINAMRFEDEALRDALGQPPGPEQLAGEEPVRAGRPEQ